MKRPTLQFAFVCCSLALLTCLAGCQESSPVQYKLNSVELLKQEKLLLDNGDQFDASYKQEIGSILTALFGTPDEPIVPMLLGDEDPIINILDQEKVARSAGPANRTVAGNAGGLYRRHCSHCHGVSGDGHGPTAYTLNPYPRDFRLAKFKYKATPLRSVPTDHDLTQVLMKGVPGSSMPSFRTLDDAKIASLVDYVKFLTMRGQYERLLMEELGNLDEGQPLIDMELMKRYHELSAIEDLDEDQEEEFEEVEEDYLDMMFEVIGERVIDDVVSRWEDADDNTTEIPESPSAFSPDDEGYLDFVSTGRQLFYQKGNCAQCHGQTGQGNGQLENFDDWTVDWTKTPGVNPFNPTTYQDFIKAGALPPRPIKPRNLTEAVYRGGGEPEELYLRIANGIEGTPMPAAPALTPEEIWALVAFVKYLPYNEISDLPPLRVNEKAIAR